MTVVLETPRLILREFAIHDTDFIIDLVNCEGWIKYIGDRNIKTEEQAKNYLINGPLKSYRENGFGLCSVDLKETQIAIGMCGLIKRNYLENIDIGFAFLPQYSGKGYGYEIAKATLNYAKDNLKLKTIDAITLPSNSNSIKLIEKIGMSYHSVFIDPNTNEELLLYRIELHQ